MQGEQHCLRIGLLLTSYVFVRSAKGSCGFTEASASGWCQSMRMIRTVASLLQFNGLRALAAYTPTQPSCTDHLQGTSLYFKWLLIPRLFITYKNWTLYGFAEENVHSLFLKWNFDQCPRAQAWEEHIAEMQNAEIWALFMLTLTHGYLVDF